MIKRYAKERTAGEHFGDFVVRAGIVKATTAGNNFHENVVLAKFNRRSSYPYARKHPTPAPPRKGEGNDGGGSCGDAGAGVEVFPTHACALWMTGNSGALPPLPLGRGLG